MAGVQVRKAGSVDVAMTSAAGRFIYPMGWMATFWKDGYFIESDEGQPGSKLIRLRELPATDHEEYSWQRAEPETYEYGQYRACGSCHQAIFDEWKLGAHANATRNQHFRNLFEGSDKFSSPGIGWNLRQERPDGVSVCTSCHAPTQQSDFLVDDDVSEDQRDRRRNDELSGVHCDYCHKVVGPADGKVGLAHGQYGLKLLRPKDQQLLFGPLTDSTRSTNAYSAFQHQSRLCASCHEGIVFGVPVYTTYSEWQASPSARAGVQCQDCHMKPTGKMTNIAPGHGGVERDPKTLANHVFFDGSRDEMLRRCLKLSVNAKRNGNDVRVSVELMAEGVGHRVPTGFVDRNLVMLVEALDVVGNPLAVSDGPRLPAIAGRMVAGKTGRLYAKQLKDFDGHSPVPFWRADPEVTDTRLEPGKLDSSAWRFPAAATQIRVRILHRRFWPEVAEAKGWGDNEVLLLERKVVPGE